MKRFFSIFVLVLLAIVMVGCGPEKEEDNDDIIHEDVDKVLDEEFVGLFEGKTVYLTTIGQQDIDTMLNLLTIGLELDEDAYIQENVLEAEDVEEGAVVMLVLGSSGKGLGEAGTNQAKEEARARDFANRAEKGEITLVSFHVGGKARRGTVSDTNINTVIPKSHLVLIDVKGNDDGLFTTLTEDNNVPFHQFSNLGNMTTELKKLFGI